MSCSRRQDCESSRSCRCFFAGRLRGFSLRPADGHDDIRHAYRIYSTSHATPLALSECTSESGPFRPVGSAQLCIDWDPALSRAVSAVVILAVAGRFAFRWPGPRMSEGGPSRFSADRPSPAVFHVGRSSPVAEPSHDGRSRADLGELDRLGGLVRQADAPQRMDSHRCRPIRCFENLYDRFYAAMHDMAIIEHLAFASALSDPDHDPYFEPARRWALAAAKIWKNEATNKPDASKAYSVLRILKALAVAYDLLYDRLTAAERTELRETLAAVGHEYFVFFADPTAAGQGLQQASWQRRRGSDGGRRPGRARRGSRGEGLARSDDRKARRLPACLRRSRRAGRAISRRISGPRRCNTGFSFSMRCGG